MQILYTYITRFNTVFNLYRDRNISNAALITLAMLGLIGISELGPFTALFWGISILGTTIWLFIYAVSIDFMAQLLGKKSQSLRLFQWLILSLLPYCLEPALGTLALALVPGMRHFIPLLLFIWVLSLQVRTIRELYQVTGIQLFLLFLLPFIPLIIIIVLLGSSFIGLSL